jgi:hypothetical protein
MNCVIPGRPRWFFACLGLCNLGIFFNVCIMAAVSLAAIKIVGHALISRARDNRDCLVVTVIFQRPWGLRAVLLTDFLLFIMAMVGAVAAAVNCFTATRGWRPERHVGQRTPAGSAVRPPRVHES